MQQAEVRRHFQRVPFEPLLVRMVSGTEYEVRTPESVISPRYASFLVEGGLIEVVALEYIEAIRPLDGRRARRAHRTSKRR